MTRIRVCIIDDERLARGAIAKLLATDPSIEIAGEAGDGKAAVRLLKDRRPDLVFLDIKMPGLDGFELLNRLGKAAPRHVVFVTAYDTFAIKAFEVEAIDYLLKPFDDRAFYRVLERAKRRVLQAQLVDYSERLAVLSRYLHGPTESDARDGAERIAIRSDGAVHVLETARIDWIGAAEHYCEVHVGTQTHLIRESMSQLERRLPPQQFIRIHRSTIVNRARIKTLVPAQHGDYTCVLTSGTSLRVSRSRAESLRRLLDT